MRDDMYVPSSRLASGEPSPRKPAAGRGLPPLASATAGYWELPASAEQLRGLLAPLAPEADLWEPSSSGDVSANGERADEDIGGDDPLLAGARHFARAGAAALGAAAVVGCAALPPAGQSGRQALAPSLAPSQAGAFVEYVAGKSELANGRADRALQHFEKAAGHRPDWADAHNGRVVALARLGRHDDAIDAARQAIDRGLVSSEIESNLALLMKRRAPAERANLASQSPAPALARSEPIPPAAVTAAAASPVIGEDASTTTLSWVRHGTNVLELRTSRPVAPTLDASPRIAQAAAGDPVAAPTSLPTPAPMAAVQASMAAKLPAAGSTATPTSKSEAAPAGRSVAAATRQVVVEVSNGVGRRHLARNTARQIAAPGLAAVRVTNHKHFKVQQSEIRYRGPAQEAEANALAQRLPVQAIVIADASLRSGVDIKLVLGADAARMAEAGPRAGGGRWVLAQAKPADPLP